MKFTLLIAAVLIILGFVYWKDINQMVLADNVSDNGNSKSKTPNASSDIVIRQQWDLPDDLKEVSGIAYLDKDRFACVQDELGTIFIFNTGSKKIEKQIPFAGAGDYEGITVNNNMAYVVRADGRLYEVNIDEGIKSVKEYPTQFTIEQNVEGLCFDKSNNRLLLAIKGDEPGNKDYKGIYAFDLSSKKLSAIPVFRINLKDNIFANAKSKKDKAIMPSEVALHPVTGDLYIADGRTAKLLIMDTSGRMKALYNLGKKFSQPEGIAFSPQGDLFISNEGTKLAGNIIQVEITP